jgi:hypothetical protein
MIAVHVNADHHDTGMPLEPAFQSRLAPRRLRVSGGRGGIDLVDLPKFTCDLYMADRIEEVAKNRVCVCMHVGALAMILEIFKFSYRVLLGHDVFDLQFDLGRKLSIPPSPAASCNGIVSTKALRSTRVRR